MPIEIPDELADSLKEVATASAATTKAVLEFADNQLGNAASPSTFGDEFFGTLWTVLDEAGIVWNSNAHGHLAMMQILQNLTAHITRAAAWQNVHKGTHFFNLGLVHISNGDVDAAFRNFLLADEEDQRHAGTNAGDLFRSQHLFDGLRNRFFDDWLSSGAPFNDGLADADRLGVVERLVRAIPDLHLLARCHQGLFRTCLIFHQRTANVPQPVGAYLLAVEDLAVLAEASAKRLHFAGQFQTGVTFGVMCNSSSDVGALGFDLNAYPTKFDVDTEATARSIIADARGGDRAAMARVVSGFRNISAHAHPFPGWTLDSALLWDVVLILLDFITTTSAEVERTYVAPPQPAPAKAAAAPSGGQASVKPRMGGSK